MPLVVGQISVASRHVLSGGNFSATMDCGTSPTWMLLAVAGDGPFSATASIGGTTATMIDEHDKVTFYFVTGAGLPSGNQTVTWSQFYHGATVDAVLYTGTAGGDVSVYDYAGSAGAFEPYSYTIDTTTDVTQAWVVYRRLSTGGTTPQTGTTEDNDQAYASDEHWQGHETVESDGSRTVGSTSGSGVGSSMYVVLIDAGINVEPDPIDLLVEVLTPAIAGPNNVAVFPAVIELLVEVLRPTVTVPVPRSLPLVGTHVEPPGRVADPSGLTTPMLSHDGAEPTWVEAPTPYVPRTRLVPLTTTGASGDPELVWDTTTDELVYTEFYE